MDIFKLGFLLNFLFQILLLTFDFLFFLQERQLENLIDVNLNGCKFITELPKLQAPNLENLNLSHCENLVKLPKLWAPNLKNLDLSLCRNLVEIDECFGSLEKLEAWYLDHCENLQILSS